MAILTGIFVLFCAGFVVGQTLMFVRSDDPPKPQPQKQVIMQMDQHPGRAGGIPPKETRDDRIRLAQDQETREFSP